MARRPHLRLDARAGWRAAELSPGLEVDRRGRLALRPRPGTGRPLVDEAGSFGGLVHPTGIAVDGRGRIYLLDAGAHRLKRYDPCACRFEVLPCVGGEGSAPRRVRDPHGLAISPAGDLYLADSGNRRLQVFALKGLALRRVDGPYRVERGERGADGIRLLPAAPFAAERGAEGLPEAAGRLPEGTWEPWDLAIDGCTLWVSDPANGLVHRFDLGGGWHGAIEAEEAGEPLVRPTHLAVDGSGRLYVAQEGRDHVAVFDPDGRLAERVRRPRDVEGRFLPTALAVDGEGNLYLSCRGRSSAHGKAAERAYLYRPGGDGGLESPGPPLAGCRRVVAFDAAGNPLALDGDRLLALEHPLTFESDGRFVSEALDSRIYRCPWHRVILEAEVAPGTRVRVETFSSEGPKGAAEIAALPESRWTLAAEHDRVEPGEWDCLVRSAPGRYLWLRLTLSGDGTASPGIGGVRIEFPRDSSLRHLPAVYQEDVEARDFLDRFLSLVDSLREETGDRLDDLALYFDPAATPADSGPGEVDFLTWLASWVGLSLERHWPVERRRRLLAQAHRLYALRGTPEGLKLHVRLYTDLEPRILEHFRARRWLHLGSSGLGDCAELWGADIVERLQLDVHSRIGDFRLVGSGDPVSDPVGHLAHRFTVYVPLAAAASEEQRQTLRRIVELAKPAHTEGDVVVVEPLLRVGVQSRVGVDTVVGRYPEGVVAGEAELGRGTVLGPSEDEASPPTLTVGERSRIGSSTLID